MQHCLDPIIKFQERSRSEIVKLRVKSRSSGTTGLDHDKILVRSESIQYQISLR